MSHNQKCRGKKVMVIVLNKLTRRKDGVYDELNVNLVLEIIDEEERRSHQTCSWATKEEQASGTGTG